MIANTKVVALLPIKTNSERVKGKNFRRFNGRPLFHWVLDTLLAVEEIQEIVINTDARELLAQHGLVENDRIRIRDRKPEICGDLISMNLVLADDVANVPADIYVMTHTTNPLLSPATVRRALSLYQEALRSETNDSLFSVNRIQSRFYRADASAINHDPAMLLRTQDLEPWFEENSNLYIFTASSFAETGARIGKKPLLHEMCRLECLDIDDEEGWQMAEALCQYLSRNNH